MADYRPRRSAERALHSSGQRPARQFASQSRPIRLLASVTRPLRAAASSSSIDRLEDVEELAGVEPAFAGVEAAREPDLDASSE